MQDTDIIAALFGENIPPPPNPYEVWAGEFMRPEIVADMERRYGGSMLLTAEGLSETLAMNEITLDAHSILVTAYAPPMPSPIWLQGEPYWHTRMIECWLVEARRIRAHLDAHNWSPQAPR